MRKGDRVRPVFRVTAIAVFVATLFVLHWTFGSKSNSSHATNEDDKNHHHNNIDNREDPLPTELVVGDNNNNNNNVVDPFNDGPIRYSVVVPAYKEQGNLKHLTERLFRALSESRGSDDGMDMEKQTELIIVDDDSEDGSVELVESLRKRGGYNVRILVRTQESGLSSAVIHGIKHARGENVVSMDADLQHPPETVPELFNALTHDREVEFVLGTRYHPRVAIDKHWPLHRRIISWGARLLARPLTSLSDPMSGFFGIKKAVFTQRGSATVSPLGYKIALELFVKCKITKFSEVGFSFAARSVGQSKLTGKVMVYYVLHLGALYWFEFGLLLVFPGGLGLGLAFLSGRHLLRLKRRWGSRSRIGKIA